MYLFKAYKYLNNNEDVGTQESNPEKMCILILFKSLLFIIFAIIFLIIYPFSKKGITIDNESFKLLEKNITTYNFTGLNYHYSFNYSNDIDSNISSLNDNITIVEEPFFKDNINLSTFGNILNDSNITPTFIDIDNRLSCYENDMNFSNYTSDNKPIAFYFVKEQYQNLTDEQSRDMIMSEINLAKSHGIYGFAFLFKWSENDKIIFDNQVKSFLNCQNISFHFFLIFDNVNILSLPKDLYENMEGYLLDERYIKLNGKTLIGIHRNLKVKNLLYSLLRMRNQARRKKIELFIIFNFRNIYRF